ncbi:MAG: hypothetical protein AB1805_07435 [Nitrospirota bacterium]
MKLRDARLCLDCEEVYQAEGVLSATCPVCGSESVTLLCRWVPTMREFEQVTVETKAAGDDVTASTAR